MHKGAYAPRKNTMGTLKETRDRFPRIQWLDSGKPGVPGTRTSLLQVTGKMPTASFGVRAVGHMTPEGWHVNCHAMEFDKTRISLCEHETCYAQSGHFAMANVVDANLTRLQWVNQTLDKGPGGVLELASYFSDSIMALKYDHELRRGQPIADGVLGWLSTRISPRVSPAWGAGKRAQIAAIWAALEELKASCPHVSVNVSAKFIGEPIPDIAGFGGTNVVTDKHAGEPGVCPSHLFGNTCGPCRACHGVPRDVDATEWFTFRWFTQGDVWRPDLAHAIRIASLDMAPALMPEWLDTAAVRVSYPLHFAVGQVFGKVFNQRFKMATGLDPKTFLPKRSK